MEEELNQLENLSARLKRMTCQIKLYKLLIMAKQAYDRYDYDLGGKSLREAFNIDKKNPIVLRGLGCIKQSQGDYFKAIKYYQKALKYSETKEIEYTLIGTVYYLQEALDKAVEYFNKAIDLNDDYTEAYEGRNQAMLENHIKIVDLQEALKKYF